MTPDGPPPVLRGGSREPGRADPGSPADAWPDRAANAGAASRSPATPGDPASAELAAAAREGPQEVAEDEQRRSAQPQPPPEGAGTSSPETATDPAADAGAAQSVGVAVAPGVTSASGEIEAAPSGAAAVRTDARRGAVEPSVTGVALRSARAGGGTVALSAAGSGPVEPPRPSGGTVYHSEPVPDRRLRSGRLRHGLPWLRIGAHIAQPATLDLLGPVRPTAGLILGRDARHRPVMLRLFPPGRDQMGGTRLVLAGGGWPMRIIVLRALAVGVRVEVLTRDPAWWQRLAEQATGRPDGLLVRPCGHREPTPSAGRLLLVHDGGRPAPDPGLGVAQLAWLGGLVTGQHIAALAEADVVLAHQVTSGEAELIGRALRLPSPRVRALSGSDPEVVVSIGPDADRHLWLAPTAVERHVLGDPRRPAPGPGAATGGAIDAVRVG